MTVTTPTNGTITPGTTTYNYGQSPVFAITPAAGYGIVNVMVDGVNVGAVTSYQFPALTADHTLSATFAQYQYVITATAGNGGTISPVGATNMVSGGNQTYTITPATGYHITGGHSFILDSLAHYGLVGAAILFFMYRAIYNEFYRPFSDKAGYGFVIYSFLMPLGLSVVNTGMWQQNLCVFMPMFLMAIYGKEFAPESAIPKYPRASAAKLRKKEG